MYKRQTGGKSVVIVVLCVVSLLNGTSGVCVGSGVEEWGVSAGIGFSVSGFR